MMSDVLPSNPRFETFLGAEESVPSPQWREGGSACLNQIQEMWEKEAQDVMILMCCVFFLGDGFLDAMTGSD